MLSVVGIGLTAGNSDAGPLLGVVALWVGLALVPTSGSPVLRAGAGLVGALVIAIALRATLIALGVLTAS